LGVLVAHGFAARDALVGILALFDYTLGATFEEQADPIRRAPESQSRPTTASPALAGAIAALSKGPRAFDGGVALLIGGLEGQLQLARRSGRKPPGRAARRQRRVPRVTVPRGTPAARR